MGRQEYARLHKAAPWKLGPRTGNKTHTCPRVSMGQGSARPLAFRNIKGIGHGRAFKQGGRGVTDQASAAAAGRVFDTFNGFPGPLPSRGS